MLLQAGLDDGLGDEALDSDDDEEKSAADVLRSLGILIGVDPQKLVDMLAYEEGWEEEEEEEEEEGGEEDELPDFTLPCWQRQLFDGSRISVGRFAFALLREKRAGRIRDTVFNRLLGLLSDHVFPEANLAPRYVPPTHSTPCTVLCYIYKDLDPSLLSLPSQVLVPAQEGGGGGGCRQVRVPHL
jgi:hypothetical protein